MRLPANFEIPSMVPKGRCVLTVGEVADRWRVTDQHVVDLIDSGELVAVDVSGRRECFPMPIEALNQLATRLRVPPAQLMEFVRGCRKTVRLNKGRSCWRVPVVEGFQAFMLRRNSLNAAKI